MREYTVIFEGGRPLGGRIEKPTGAKNEHVIVKGNHVVSWYEVAGKTKYAIVEV